jgi:hypothetical protein
MADDRPPVTCLRCERWAPVFGVPFRLLPPGEASWPLLCRDCYGELLGKSLPLSAIRQRGGASAGRPLSSNLHLGRVQDARTRADTRSAMNLTVTIEMFGPTPTGRRRLGDRLKLRKKDQP